MAPGPGAVPSRQVEGGHLAQIFPRWTNSIPAVAVLTGPVAGVLVIGFVAYFFSPSYTDVGYRPKQPVPYSHKLHVGELGLDCRYCHAVVERSPVAGIPPTRLCMNCHTTVKRDSPELAPVRDSLTFDIPLRWLRVHDLPEYAYFDHSAHLHAGIGCSSCHGRIDTMEVVRQVETLSMKWCLDCHRDPSDHLRPPDEITNMEWSAPADQRQFAARVIEERRLDPPLDCSGCHR